MMRKHGFSLLFAVALLLSFAAAPPARAEGPFRTLKFDKVLAQAAKEKKLVFVDFFTTWCVPCKMLEQTTFKDDKVRAWLAGKAIAVQYDAERELDLAEKFRIEFYPTLLFLKPDGTEFERFSGYLDAAEFMALATAVEKGESVLDRLRAALKASPNDLERKAKLAEALLMRGQAGEAYDLLWRCLEDAKNPSPDFAVRVVNMLVRVGAADDDVRQKLIARRDHIEKELTGGKASDAELALYVGVNALAEEQSRTLATFDRLRANQGTASLARRLGPFVFEELVAAKRYADIAETVDLNARIDAAFAAAQTPPTDDQPPAVQEMMRLELVYGLADVYQTLVGLERVDEARRLAKRILAHSASAQTYNTLAWAGYLTGKPLEDNLAQARQAWKLDPDKNVGILDTLVRIMHSRGQTAKAIAMCEKALQRAEADSDKWVLNACLEAFRAAKTG